MNTLDSMVSSSAPIASPQRKNQLQELGSDQFIMLMVAQMKNQDPLKPADPAEFLGQLAQFSTVSGVRAMQDSMSDMVSAMRSSQMLSGTGMVGREVLGASNAATFDGATAVNAAADLPIGTSAAFAVVKDISGAVVRQIPLSARPGLNGFSWDGRDDAGVSAPPGRYSIEVSAVSAGRTESIPTLLYGRVDSVTLDSANGGLILNTSHGALPLAAVRRVL
jgi:flagellar basal-body rod modification protein FlgD